MLFLLSFLIVSLIICVFEQSLCRYSVMSLKYTVWYLIYYTHCIFYTLQSGIRSGSVYIKLNRAGYFPMRRVTERQTDAQSDRQIEETGSLNILLLKWCINCLTIKFSMHNADCLVLYLHTIAFPGRNTSSTTTNIMPAMHRHHNSTE